MNRLSLLVALMGMGPIAAAEKPNVVVILADDQGWGDLSLNGNTNLRTPHIDSLAQGRRAIRALLRAAGLLADAGGVPHRPLAPAVRRSRRLHRAGAPRPRRAHHRRGLQGGGLRHRLLRQVAQRLAVPVPPQRPRLRGVLRVHLRPLGRVLRPPLDHNGKAVKGKGYITDDLTDRAMDFLAKNAAAGKPSFCYLALNTPHSPMQVPDEYWQRFEKAPLKLTGDKKEDLDHTRAALAMCENIDDNVGRLLAALKEQKLDENTIVLYFSDNGPNGPRWNGGMKGRKGSTDEGGVRSPLHVRWPGKVKPGTVVTPIAAAVDLYPTLIDLAGISRVGDKPFDGISLAPWLLGKNPPAPDRVLFQHWGGRVSARRSGIRLDAAGQLFDMTNDPGQQRNVAAEHPEDAKRLADAVESLEARRARRAAEGR